MQIFHTSPEKITTINRFGIAGDCLFFSSNIYEMSAGETVVYSLEIDEDKVVSVSKLYDAEIVVNVAKLFDVDEDTAENLLDGSDNEWNYECDADASWELQGLKGECAKKMGYEACKDTDEQGIVYIVPMLNRESKLIEEKNNGK